MGIFGRLNGLTCRRTLRAKIVERAQSDGVQALEGSLLSKKSGVCCGETPQRKIGEVKNSTKNTVRDEDHIHHSVHHYTLLLLNIQS